MGNSKHIFLQLDSTSIIKEIEQRGDSSQAIKNEIAIKNCILFEQGSASAGNAIKNFVIDVEGGQDIYFTVLPKQLMTLDKLYFTDNGFTPNGNANISVEIENLGIHDVSFKMTIADNTPIGNHENFSFNLTIETSEGNKSKSINVTIDPMLRIQH